MACLSFVDPWCHHGFILNNALREPSAPISRLELICTIRQSTYSLISFSAFSTESDPWQMFLPTARAKSPRIEPERVVIDVVNVKRKATYRRSMLMDRWHQA